MFRRVALAWMVVVVVPTVADAYTLRTTEDGKPVHWGDTDVPFRVDSTLSRAAGAGDRKSVV